jgi:Flp pilus assembly protein TadD
MANSFLGSEEYDERAHRLYDDGEYDSALETLKEGLKLYPHSVELHIGLGYTRLAREEFVWAKQAFEQALVLDPEHEDAFVGLGESLLRFGRREEALLLFARAREQCDDDLELLLSMGRALYREHLFDEAVEVFECAVDRHADSAEAAAAFGYTLHRRGDLLAARRQLRRALQLDEEHHEARVYLGHLMYDRGDWRGALREFEHIPPADHWDPLAVSRLIELRRALTGVDPAGAELACWQSRLEELDAEGDDIDELLTTLEAAGAADVEAGRSPAANGSHAVRLPSGPLLTGSWLEIVRQIRDTSGLPGETIAQFMRRRADEERLRTGIRLPAEDPREFVRAGARAGYWLIEY